MQAQWDTGWMIWVIILAIIAGLAWSAAIGSGIYWLARGRKVSYDSLSGPVFLGAVVIALIIGAIGTVVAFPFSGQYHRYVPEAGTVAKVGSRFIASGTSGGGTDQKYVVTFADGRSYGCLDTRCANVAVGDSLTLLCKRVFQFNAPSEGWDCNWGSDRKQNGTVIP